VAVLPAEVPTGLVKGQYYFVNEDSIDVDTDPDLLVVTGSVLFTPSVTVVRMPSKAVTIILLPFKAKFDGTGNLVPANGTGTGIELVATNSPLLNNGVPFEWKVEFSLKDASTGFSVVIPNILLQVPAGSTIDLSSS
jgi:hypothetical protein